MSSNGALALVFLLTLGCSRDSASTPPPSEPALWCLVETGFGASQPVARHARDATGVSLLREAVPPGRDEYADRFSDSSEAEGQPTVSGTQLGDGTWLLYFSGAAPWWESTGVMLQLDVSGARASVRSVHLQWRADVPPLSAWAALTWGWIRLDDADLARDGVVRLRFALTGELVEPRSNAGDEPAEVRAQGAFTLRLRDETLSVLGPEVRAIFASVQPPR